MQDSSCHCLWLCYILLLVAAAWGWMEWSLRCPYNPHPLEMQCDLQTAVHGSFGLRKGWLLENPYPEPDVLHTGERTAAWSWAFCRCAGLFQVLLWDLQQRVYSDTVKEALGPFMFPAYILWLPKWHTKLESIFLGLSRVEPHTLHFHQVSPSVSYPHISKCCF